MAIVGTLPPHIFSKTSRQDFLPTGPNRSSFLGFCKGFRRVIGYTVGWRAFLRYSPLKTQISFSFSDHRTIVKNPMDLYAKNTAHFICKTLIYKQLCRDPMFWNTDKSNGFFCESKQKMACVFIKYYSPKAYVSRNPRVLDTRQTENLGGSGTWQRRNREWHNYPFVVSYWFSWGRKQKSQSDWLA